MGFDHLYAWACAYYCCFVLPSLCYCPCASCLLDTRFISFFSFFLFEQSRHSWPVLWHWAVTATSLLEEVLASSYLPFGLTSKLKKVTDDGMNLFSMQVMSWYKWLYISVIEFLTIHFYHRLINMSSCKIDYFNLQAWLRLWRVNVKIMNSKVQALPVGCGLLENRGHIL